MQIKHINYGGKMGIKDTIQFLFFISSLVTCFVYSLLYIFKRQMLYEKLFGDLPLQDIISFLLIIIVIIFLLLSNIFAKIKDFFRTKPYYNKVEHSFFYDEKGGVLTRSDFELINKSKKDLTDVPKEGFYWSDEINKDKIFFRIINRDLYDRNLKKTLPTITPTDNSNEQLLSWSPKIIPPLEKNGKIEYQVEIMTPETEQKAFSPEGTLLGFGVTLDTNLVILRAYAPVGYSFNFVNPNYSVREFDSCKQIDKESSTINPPSISPDGSVVEWVIKKPKPMRRYWVHYKFTQNAGGINWK